jgi:mycofactocin precursor
MAMADAQCPVSGTLPAEVEPVEEELLVEEVSIDGMCGVY